MGPKGSEPNRVANHIRVTDTREKLLHLEIEADVIVGDGKAISQKGDGRMEGSQKAFVSVCEPMGKISRVSGKELVSAVPSESDLNVLPGES